MHLLIERMRKAFEIAYPAESTSYPKLAKLLSDTLESQGRDATIAQTMLQRWDTGTSFSREPNPTTRIQLAAFLAATDIQYKDFWANKVPSAELVEQFGEEDARLLKAIDDWLAYGPPIPDKDKQLRDELCERSLALCSDERQKLVQDIKATLQAQGVRPEQFKEPQQELCNTDSALATTFSINLPKALRVTNEQFSQFVVANPNLRLERAPTGELIIMPPTGSESGNYNSELNADFVIWNRRAQLGKVFDSSSGFRLPNGAIRSADVAWVSQTRWNALTPEQQQGFAPICPDFVIELASPSDDVENLKTKMQEYLDNGCRLGWLINPKSRTVYIYRAQQPVETVPFPTPLSGEDVLPGFVLNLLTIFSG